MRTTKKIQRKTENACNKNYLFIFQSQVEIIVDTFHQIHGIF